MKFKKFSAIFMVLIFILCFCSCKKTPESSSVTSEGTVPQKSQKHYLTLLYSAADTFNPYTAKTDINRQLCQLLYDPLVSLDNEFNPVYKIADSVKTEGNQCTVTLKTVKFSDSSTVTADDVVYSCNLAKSSGGIYATSLYEVSSVSAKNSTTVIFKLTKADPYFQNLLTFPIIKSGSEKITDSDSVLQPPIGSGRYKVDDDRQGLVINNNYHEKGGSITEIRLINAPDSESVAHYVEVGAADIYYSNISNGNILRMSGKKLDVNLNSMIYIGINQNNEALSESELRQAISSGIDRKKICQDAYYNNALPATGFFTPVWSETKSVQNIQIQSDSQITVENLEKIGYNKLDKKNNRVNSSGKRLSFTLLVNSENRLKATAAQLIAGQLKSYGINVTLIEKPYEQYIERLKNGDFDLFLGEVRLTDNMDISSMVTEGGTAAYGLKNSTKKTDNSDKANSKAESGSQKDDNTDEVANMSQDVVNGFYSGKNTIADVASVLQTEMPFVPVCYRTGVLFFNDNIENVDNSSASDIYFSIESYIYN